MTRSSLTPFPVCDIHAHIFAAPHIIVTYMKRNFCILYCVNFNLAFFYFEFFVAWESELLWRKYASCVWRPGTMAYKILKGINENMKYYINVDVECCVLGCGSWFPHNCLFSFYQVNWKSHQIGGLFTYYEWSRLTEHINRYWQTIYNKNHPILSFEIYDINIDQIFMNDKTCPYHSPEWILK